MKTIFCFFFGHRYGVQERFEEHDWIFCERCGDFREVEIQKQIKENPADLCEADCNLCARDDRKQAEKEKKRPR